MTKDLDIINISLEVPEGLHCGEYVSNYSHNRTLFGCRFLHKGRCLIFNKVPLEADSEKSERYQGTTAKVLKLSDCYKCIKKENKDEKEV